MLWKGSVYVKHMAIEGLATAGGIQGNVADTSLAILKYCGVEVAMNWVDDFVFFRVHLLHSVGSGSAPPFKFDLSTILDITSPLGIPWHPIPKKGHDFQSTFSYVGF